MKFKLGDSVVYTKELKSLPPCSQGKINRFITDIIVSVVYGHNKGTNKVYAHSANISDLIKL